MGGKRIADHVRRALIAAAKTSAVVVAIDAAGCGSSVSCADVVPARPPPDAGQCATTTYARNLRRGEACPSAVELQQNCPMVCYDWVGWQPGFVCTCEGDEPWLTVTCKVPLCPL